MRGVANRGFCSCRSYEASSFMKRGKWFASKCRVSSRRQRSLADPDIPPEFRELVKRFTSIPQRHPSTSISFGTGKLGSVTLRRSGSSILSLFLDGRAETKPRAYVEKALGPSAGQFYLAALERLWGQDFVEGWSGP